MPARLRVVVTLGVVIAVAFGLLVGGCGDPSGAYKIGIIQIVAHPSLDATVDGFVDAMAVAGYVEGESVVYKRENAHGEMANAFIIAKKLVGDKCDLVLSVATSTSQAMVFAAKDIPVVFTAVTDPVSSGLIVNTETPEANVTGCSDMFPVEPHLELILKVVPGAKTIGLLYNAGEANSVMLVEKEKAAAEAMGLKVVEATVANSAEVLVAAQSLVGRCDAISVLTDNTVVSAIESVVKVCQDNKIPLIAGDIDSVEAGAAAAYAFDYYDHGIQAGRVAVQVLEGTPISKIPVQYAENLQFALNLESAAAMGITFSDELISQADKTF